MTAKNYRLSPAQIQTLCDAQRLGHLGYNVTANTAAALVRLGLCEPGWTCNILTPAGKDLADALCATTLSEV